MDTRGGELGDVIARQRSTAEVERIASAVEDYVAGAVEGDCVDTLVLACRAEALGPFVIPGRIELHGEEAVVADSCQRTAAEVNAPPEELSDARHIAQSIDSDSVCGRDLSVAERLRPFVG